MTAPMFKNRYMAHALGGYKGFKYLNNEDALKNAIKNEHRYFEVDLTLTEDGHVVPSHGWSEANCERAGMTYLPEFEHMTREMFLRQRVHDMPTMDTETLYQYMKKHPNFYWQLDLHTLSGERAEAVTRAVLRDFHNDRELLDRFLVQANSPEMFEGIEKVYHFNYYQLFLKRGISAEELRKSIEYCKKNGFVSTALSVHDASEENIRTIRKAGLAVLIYSLDKRKKADELFAYGANTICTNTLNPRDDRIRAKKNSKPYKIKKKIKKMLHIDRRKVMGADKSGKYVFKPEEREKQKRFYSLLIKLHRRERGEKTVNDYYFDKSIKKNTILISGLGRSVRGSMQYILNELNTNDAYKDFKIYVRTDKKKTDSIVKGYIEQNGWKRTKTINKSLSEKMESCQYLITESYFPYSWIKKPGQVMIDLWHGTPLKNLGVLKNGNKVHRTSIQQKNFLAADYLLYPNEFTRNVMWDSYQITSLLKARALMMGYPRTSGILRVDEKTAAELRKQLAPNGEHIYAYMPTFRGYLSDSESIERETEFLDYIDERLRDDQILYVNLHHKIKEGLSCDKYKHIRNFPPLVDSYSLLAVTDALISDYSSVFFDYLVLQKQIILYIEDLDTYRSFQGLNLDIEELPFDLARDKQQVIDMINRGKQYDDSEFYNAMCAFDSADNPEKFCQLFVGDERGITLENMPEDKRKKILLYSEGCVAGRDTDRLWEINSSYDKERNEIHIGCDEFITEKNTDGAYPQLHDVLILSSQDKNPWSSLGEPVYKLYRDGKISFKRAIRFLQYEYALMTRRMYGDAELDVIGIYDTVNPDMIIGLALSDADRRVLFISERMKTELKDGSRAFKDAVRYAANFCSDILVWDEEAKKLLSGVLEKEDMKKTVISKDAGDVLGILCRTGKQK